MTSVKKILVLGDSGSGKLTFMKALTGSLPDPIPSSHGGLTHELSIKNDYFSADIGIWVDEFADGVGTLCDSYASDEAREVRASLGAIVVTFRLNSLSDTVSTMLEQVKRVAVECSPNVVLLAVGTPPNRDRSMAPMTETVEKDSSAETASQQDKDSKHEPSGETSTQEWEDLCLDEGYEFINLSASGKNTFGEEQGVKRALQVLETCDWSATMPEMSEEELLAEMMAEDAALQEKLLSVSGEDKDEAPTEKSIEEMEQMMSRILMAREHLQDLSPEERKKQAIKLVAEVMR